MADSGPFAAMPEVSVPSGEVLGHLTPEDGRQGHRSKISQESRVQLLKEQERMKGGSSG